MYNILYIISVKVDIMLSHLSLINKNLAILLLS